MPIKKPAMPAARVKDPISVGLSIIVGGEDTVLIGGEAKPIACKDCKAKELTGNPVNTSSGAKVQPTETDFSLPAPAPFAMDRFYASDTPFTGLLGQGWRTMFELYCDTDDQRTRLVDIQGRWIDFAPLYPGYEQTCPSEGVWIARGTSDQNVPWDERWRWLPEPYRLEPHQIIVTSGDGDYLIFEAAVKPHPSEKQPHPIASGRFDLIALVNRHGYAQQLSWRSMRNACGETVRVPEFVSDSAGRCYRLHCSALSDEHKRQWHSSHPDTDTGIRLSGVSLAYDPLRDAKAPTDLAALRDVRTTEWLVRYRYSDAGDLIEVQDGDGDWTRRFEYAHHLMTRHQTPGTHADGTARDVRYEYDRYDIDGKVVRQKQAGGLDYAFVYSKHDTTVTDSQGRVTHYRFQGEAGLKRLVQLTHPDGAIVKFDYTNDGQLSRQIDPLGRQTRFRYTSQGDYLGSVNALGHRHELFRDPATGLITSTRDGEGGIVHYQRDAQGRITQISTPDGGKTRFDYDHPQFPDRPSGITDAKGGTKIPAYNALGQMASLTDCSGQRTQYRYDRKGRLIEIESADGKRQSYRHDRKGRIVSVTRSDGSEEAVQYDRAGNMVKAIDAEGRPVEMVYDRYGRMIEHRLWTGERNTIAGAGPAWSVTRYQHDAAGRLTQLTNAAGAAMAFGYDPMDRLVHETGFDGKRSAYVYNAAGELVGRVDADGTADAIVIGHAHDAAGRLIARHIPAWDGSPAQIHTFAWNKRNQLTSAVTHDSRIDFTYDVQGHLIAETQSGADGHSHTLRYGYDELGNRKQLMLPDGHCIDTLLYGSGHWHQVAFDGHPLVDVERDSLHREISRTYGSGSAQAVAHPLMRSQSYTVLGQLDAVAFTRGGKMVEQRLHRYDTAGLLTRIEHQLHGARTITRYGYDGQQRLTAWDTHDVIDGAPTIDHPMGRDSFKQTRSEAYGYDQAGNPVQPGTVIRRDPVSNMPVYVAPGEWDALVKAHAGNPDFNLLGMTPVRPNRIAQLGTVFHDEYDQRGNVKKRRAPEGVWEYAWNALDQMTASRFIPHGNSSDAPTHAGAYFYDAFGRRTGKLFIDLRTLGHDAQGQVLEDSVPRRVTRYLWDGDRMLQELHGSHTRTIVYEPGGFVPLAQVISGKLAGPGLSAQERETKRAEQHGLTQMFVNPAIPPEARQAAATQLRLQAGSTQIHMFVTDHLGTPVGMIDAATQEVLWEREQDPWGNTIRETMSERLAEEHRPNLRFQGQQYDTEIDLCYNRHRYYDARMHRYVTQDPIGLWGGINFYAYPVNPAQWVDQLGLKGGISYDPNTWNSPGIIDHNNCYTYAANRPYMFKLPGTSQDKPQPGEASGQPFYNKPNPLSCSAVADGARSDGMTNPDKKGNCPKKSHKVYLVIAPGQDYHWYRQDKTGTWSHKPGNTNATNTDASKKPITNPEKADRDYGALNYSIGCQYLCAKD